MARVFAQALALSRGGRLLGVTSRDIARARAFAPSGAMAFSDLATMLARPEIDICYIATPTHRHLADCLEVLAAGKAVLCEKPLATSAAEARTIAEVAAQSGRFCMEALWTHFLPAVGEAADLVRAGALGAPLVLTASFGLPLSEAAIDLRRMPGGGALLDRGCYPISLALRLLGPVSSVSGRTTLLPSGADRSAELLLGFTGGHAALIATSFDAYAANDLVIAGPAARLRLHEPITAPSRLSTVRSPRAVWGAGGALSAKDRLRRMLRRVPGMQALARLRRTRTRRLDYQGSGHIHQIEEVHRCLAERKPQSDVVSLALSIATLDVIDRVRKIARSDGA